MGADRSNSRQRPCLVRYLRPPTCHKSRGPCFLLVARGNHISYHLLKEPLDFSAGMAMVPQGPGLGIEFDERALHEIVVG